MFRLGATTTLLILTGCQDSLLGKWSIESRIGSIPLPAGALWEVRWVQEGGLAVDCERLDAGAQEEQLAVFGSVVLPLPTAAAMPEPHWVDAGAYRYALGLPVLVVPGAAYPPVGDGWESLEVEGVWGTSAPIAWLEVEGDRTAASNDLTPESYPVQTQGWVEVYADIVMDDGSIEGSLDPIPAEFLGGELWGTELVWTDNESYSTWSGGALGGIVSTCEGM